MTGIAEMVHDPRPISGIFWGEDDHDCFVVGYGGVTKITPYYENGQMAAVPWFAIYIGDVLIARRDAAGCRVDYHIAPAKPEPEDEG